MSATLRGNGQHSPLFLPGQSQNILMSDFAKGESRRGSAPIAKGADYQTAAPALGGGERTALAPRRHLPRRRESVGGRRGWTEPWRRPSPWAVAPQTNPRLSHRPHQTTQSRSRLNLRRTRPPRNRRDVDAEALVFHALQSPDSPAIQGNCLAKPPRTFCGFRLSVA